MNDLYDRLRPVDEPLDAATADRVWARIAGRHSADDLFGVAPPAASERGREAVNGAHHEGSSPTSVEDGTGPDAIGFDEDRSSPRRRRYAVVGAAAVIIVSLAGFIALEGGTRSTPLPSVATPAALGDAGEPETSVVPVPNGNAAPLPIDTISWQHATDTGSLARSQVAGIVAGPGGFVATGMGFDDGKNQGRVWYSPDGLTWVEPALDIFDAKGVGYPASTSDAFFVVAASNTDRLGLGEGAPSPNDAQLFRSEDGQNWEPWGEPWGEFGSLAAVEDVLLRQQPDGPLEWSADGLTWNPATFADNPGDEHRFLDLWPGGVIHGDGVTYLRGFDGQSFVIWSSTDSRQWHMLPAPPAGGSVATVPDGLIVITNPREPECTVTANSIFDARHPADDVEARIAALDEGLRSQWGCATQPDIYRLDEPTGTWMLNANHPGATPVIPTTVRVGNTLVAAIIAPDKAMTIWTAAVDQLAWTEQPATHLDFIENTGSPGAATAAASADRVIVISPDRLVDGETAVIIGTIGTPDSD